MGHQDLPYTSPWCGPGIWCFACGYYCGIDYDQLHLITVCKASELKEGGIRFMNTLFVYSVPSHIPPLTRILPPGKIKTAAWQRPLVMACHNWPLPNAFLFYSCASSTFDTCIQCTFLSLVCIYLLFFILGCVFCLYYITSFWWFLLYFTYLCFIFYTFTFLI